MSQKVKVQMTAELSDIPKFCATNLQPTVEEVKTVINEIIRLQAELMTVQSHKTEDINVLLSKIEQIRVILGKADNRLVDLYVILSGLVQIEQQSNQFVEKEISDNDSHDTR